MESRRASQPVPGQPVGQNTYVLDAENAAEQARLLDQDVLLTEAMGGPLADHSERELDAIYDVLDIVCGQERTIRG